MENSGVWKRVYDLSERAIVFIAVIMVFMILILLLQMMSK